MRFLYTKIILILLCITLIGCGFHLRRPQPLAPELNQVVLMPDAIFTPLQREIINHLALADSTVVDSGVKNAPILTILNDSYSDITLSVGSDGQTREKLLVYTLSFQLTDPVGNFILAPNMIRLNRVVKYDPDFVLAKGYEEDKMLHDMRVDAVNQIVTQLSFLQSAQFYPIPGAGAATPVINHEVNEDASTQSPDRDLMPTIDTDIVGD
jgi:LPS-assembly lipoprotein